MKTNSGIDFNTVGTVDKTKIKHGSESMLVTAGRILDAYDKEQFSCNIVYGELGAGKSSYSLKCLNEIYNTWDWTELKKHLVYTPEEFINKVKNQTEREKVLVWDDAGVWLFNLETHDPFIKAVTKWFSVARTQFSGIIFTTPSPMWIVKKIRFIPATTIIKISATRGGKSGRLRVASAYRNWIAPDFKHTGVKKMYEDHFNIWLPDELYSNYKPFRESYVKRLQEQMTREYKRQEKKDGTNYLEEKE